MKIVVIARHTQDLLNFQCHLLYDLICEGHHVTVCGPENRPELRARFLEMQIPFVQIPLNRTSINPLKEGNTIFFLYKTLRKIYPDIVFNTGIKPSLYGSLASRLAGIPRVYSMFEGLGFSFSGKTLKARLVKKIIRLLCRLNLKKNQAVFFLNPDDISLFLDSKLIRREQGVLINGCGVDLGYYPSSSFPDNKKLFLLIARLIKDKGVMEYVEAARTLKKRYPNVLFRLLGRFDTNPSGIKQAQMEKWRREGVIDYCGEVQDVRPFIAAASVYVLPSYREGMPRTILEAMAMGRPIITTDAPGCRETVIDGENGFLVPIRSVDALVHAMERFIKNPGLIPKMGKRSREIAMEKFDVHRVNAKIMKTMGLLDPARTKDDFKKNE